MWHSLGGPSQRAWIACGVLALVAKLALSINTVGTSDVLTWHLFANSIDAHGALSLYRADPMFNHPPFMARVLPVINWLGGHTALGFPFWIRFPGILADLGSLFLMALILQDSPRLLVLFALCPISVLVSGFHGNTDPIMIFFVLLSIYFLGLRKWLSAAGVAVGIAASIKIVPVVFAPAFLFYLGTNRRRVLFGVVACATFALLSSPYLIQDPAVIARNVLGYHGQPGVWGFQRLAKLIMHRAGFAGPQLAAAAAIITTSMWLLSRRSVSLYARCAVSAFLFLWLTPGFAVQYLAWLAPFALFFGEAWTIAVYASSGLFLFLVYNYWSHGFPWYYADPDSVVAVGGQHYFLFQFVVAEIAKSAAWIIIGLTLFAYLRRAWGAGSFEEVVVRGPRGDERPVAGVL